MTRAAATVLVRPVDDAGATLRCLERVRPTLTPRDAVVVLLPQGAPAVRAASRGVRYLSLEVGETPAERAARAVAGTGTPLIADLHADVTVTPHWLDRLAAALEDPLIQAVGPRANAAPLRQFVPGADYGKQARTSLREFDRQFTAGQDEPLTYVDGELADFCRLRRHDGPAAGRSAVVNGVFVHHDAADGCPDTAVVEEDSAAPLLSAALIVKDEQDCIAQCISAAWRFADEVVVYDTGSTDRTCEIAAGLGATVVRGFWDSDFGAARNRGLAHCTGRWVLVVDADEVVLGDPEALRARLRRGRCEGLLVPISNLSSGGAGSTSQHLNLRIFRRRDGRYDGRLHEQVVHSRLAAGSPAQPRTTCCSSTPATCPNASRRRRR